MHRRAWLIVSLPTVLVSLSCAVGCGGSSGTSGSTLTAPTATTTTPPTTPTTPTAPTPTAPTPPTTPPPTGTGQYTTGVTGGETDLKVYIASSPSGPWTNPQLVTISGVNALLAIDPQPILAADGSLLLIYAISTTNQLPSGSTRIGIASSTDGINFTQRNVVYTAGGDGFPNVSDPCAVLLPDGRVRVFIGNAGPRVYSATSTDSSGVSFTGALDTGIRSNINAGVCGAMRTGSQYFLYENGLVYSTSSDGLTFTSKGSVNLSGDAPSPIDIGGSYVMAWQSNGRVGPDQGIASIATSSDGIVWNTVASGIFPGNMPGLVRNRSGQYLMYVVTLHGAIK